MHIKQWLKSVQWIQHLETSCLLICFLPELTPPLCLLPVHSNSLGWPVVVAIANACITWAASMVPAMLGFSFLVGANLGFFRMGGYQLQIQCITLSYFVGAQKPACWECLITAFETWLICAGTRCCRGASSSLSSGCTQLMLTGRAPIKRCLLMGSHRTCLHCFHLVLIS